MSTSPLLPTIEILSTSRVIWPLGAMEFKSKKKKTEALELEFELKFNLNLSLSSGPLLPKAKLFSMPKVARQRESWSLNHQKKKKKPKLELGFDLDPNLNLIPLLPMVELFSTLKVAQQKEKFINLI